MSTSIQPLNSIGPADPEKAREEELKKDPAKRDYLQGREQFKKGDYNMAAMSFQHLFLRTGHHILLEWQSHLFLLFL
ncbi:MAG: hypothetical protein D3916_07460 [Candidatus Electrothrix sp. MAN1_4]|nr:hypothetical protein [Candidatus Electrothrix sp. MAN1_4]